VHCLPFPYAYLFMSGTSTPAQDRDTQLLSIGQQCSHPSCLLIDFLPFKCQHCAEPYCGEHFPVAAHKCDKYDESKYNRVAPSCPLCNAPIAIRPGLDPNIRMEQHITSDCSAMTGKSGKSKSTPVCARGKCRKVLFAPIRCDKCKEQFCPQHRFPADHDCAAFATSSSSKPSPGSKSLLKLHSETSASRTATTDSFRKTMESASSSTTPAHLATAPKPLITDSKSAVTHTNPFAKSDRSPPLTTSPITTDNIANTTKSLSNKPEPIIDPMSFVPRPLFASA